MAYTAIDDPTVYFQVQLYTGTGSSQAVTLGGDTDMAIDLLWIHNRDAAEGIDIYDSIRGVTSRLRTSNANAQDDQSANSLSAFGSDGFTVLTNTAVNADTNKYVAYCWKAGTTFSNSASANGADIASSGTYSTAAGFSTVIYTGNRTTGTDIYHGLGNVPKFIACKSRTDDNGWVTGHVGTSDWDYHQNWHTTGAAVDDENQFGATPAANVFTAGSSPGTNNAGGQVAYVFADVQGFSKFGSYEGNGNADGTFVYVGFRPAFVMCKSIDSTSDWLIFDDQREGYNVDNDSLKANDNAAEATTDMIDILSNGFKCRIATDPNVAETYIYAAFAKAPLVNSEGVPVTAR